MASPTWAASDGAACRWCSATCSRLGASTLETPQDPNTPGDTRGFDAITGKLKWTFHSVPRPGEMGHETWLNDGWKDRSGTNIWNHHMTADEQLGLLYLPISGPASNYYGGDRPGDNLFGNSIVAIDGNTGAVQVALSAGAPRHLGLRQPARARAARDHARRPADPGARADWQVGLDVHPRSQERQAGLRRGRAPRRQGRRAR